MRYITIIENENELKSNLNDIIKNHKSYRVRNRAMAIKMSIENKITIPQLSKYFNVKKRAIYDWYNRFDKYGIIGLIDKKGRGRKRKIEGKKKLENLVKKYPIQISNIVAEYLKIGISVSKETIKRELKKLGYNYKRLKKFTAKTPDIVLVEKAKKDIEKFKEEEKKGNLSIYYYDESSFSLESNIPYGWQKINEYIKIPNSKSKSVKVMGFLNPDKNDLKSYMSTSTVNSDFVIACFDDFIEQLDGKQTIVILDNAPTHTSNKFQDKIEEWKNRGLSVYFIPPYSPNLNKIETLWRFMKYYWFELSSYLSFDNLWAYVEKVLGLYGASEEYVINFG